MKRIIQLTLVALALACSAEDHSLERTVAEKVVEADLIVVGVATAEGTKKPRDSLPFPQSYQQSCRIAVTEVLWPIDLTVTNDIVIPHYASTNWPTSWWNYNGTTGVYFFVQASPTNDYPWIRLPLFDDWLEPVTNLLAIKAQITKKKANKPLKATSQ